MVAYYEKVFGFTQIFEEYIDVAGQGMRSKVVQCPSRRVTLVLIEPDPARRPGQIDDFLKWHDGPGVQHLGLLTDDEVDQLLAASDRYYAGERNRRLPVRPPKLAYWEPEHGQVQRHNDYVHYAHDAIAAILRKPLIGAVAARLAQVTQIRIFQATMIYKPPVPGEPTNIVPWHMDKHYWSSSSSDRMLTAFIPFHDCDEKMGTITMVDRSHLWEEVDSDDSTVKRFAERDRAHLERLLAENAAHNRAEVKKIPMNIPKGHMSFHHCRIYHGSGANLSDRPRRSIALHLQDGDNAYREFPLSDGSFASYNHDVLVRRTADGRPDYADPEFCPVIWPATNNQR